MQKLIFPVALGFFAAAGPAVAFEPLTVGEAELSFEGELYLTAVQDDGDLFSDNYLDLYLTYTQPVGTLTFGVELYSGLTYESESDPEFYVNDDPYVDVGLWLEGDDFGYLAYSDTSSAIGEDCVEAPSTGENFGQDDFVSVGTCPSFDSRSVLFYRTPDLGGGLQIAASYMPETGFESVEDGEAAESASLALILDRTDASGAVWTGSIGFEKVLGVEGGGPEATTFQAGLNWERDGWIVGGAVALTDNGDQTEDHGIGLGVSREINEKLTVSFGMNQSRSRADGAELDETSAALIGMYSIVPDTVILDGGIWHIRTTDGGIASSRNVIGIGLSAFF
jgi:hypothetical protein